MKALNLLAVYLVSIGVAVGITILATNTQSPFPPAEKWTCSYDSEQKFDASGFCSEMVQAYLAANPEGSQMFDEELSRAQSACVAVFSQ